MDAYELPTPPEAAGPKVLVWKMQQAQECMAYFCLQALERQMALHLSSRFLTNSTFIVGKFLRKDPGFC